VRVENAPLSGAHAFTDPALDLQNLVAGVDQAPFEPADLLWQLLVGKLTSSDARTAAVDHQEPAAAHSC
jgi:hypothetical protein